ncbi:hypothetical protein [Fodinicola feengrottensis]|uniref:hypothetical protein n=1 Tax=Fodinicola feengrottensis TaxID=435914 RepID=UPI0036F1DE87
MLFAIHETFSAIVAPCWLAATAGFLPRYVATALLPAPTIRQPSTTITMSIMIAPPIARMPTSLLVRAYRAKSASVSARAPPAEPARMAITAAKCALPSPPVTGPAVKIADNDRPDVVTAMAARAIARMRNAMSSTVDVRCTSFRPNVVSAIHTTVKRP